MAEREITGDPAAPSGSLASVEPPSGVSPVPASIPIARESEHLPLLHHPESHWQFGINYGARRVRAFMCKVDWEHELGHAAGGNRIFPSIEDLKSCRRCVAQCGIVEVEVTLYRVHQWEDFERDLAQGIVTEGGDALAAPGAAQPRVEPGRPEGDAP